LKSNVCKSLVKVHELRCHWEWVQEKALFSRGVTCFKVAGNVPESNEALSTCVPAGGAGWFGVLSYMVELEHLAVTQRVEGMQ